jgi:hypothetical protein
VDGQAQAVRSLRDTARDRIEKQPLRPGGVGVIVVVVDEHARELPRPERAPELGGALDVLPRVHIQTEAGVGLGAHRAVLPLRRHRVHPALNRNWWTIYLVATIAVTYR